MFEQNDDIQFIIVSAVSENGVIGTENGIPWRGYESDRDFMHKLTNDKPTIVGENTYNPHSSNIEPYRIVLTEDPTIGDSVDNVLNAANMNECEDCINHINSEGYSKFYVLGGAKTYSEFLPFADKLYITRIPEVHSGDTYFPFFNIDKFELSERIDLDDCYVQVFNQNKN